MIVKPELNVALVQTDIYWENSTANLSSLEEKIAKIEKPFDLLLLPEMFNVGFTMNTDLAEPMNLTTTRWMKQIAKRYNALIIGSIPIKEGKQFYNRLLSVFPNGDVKTVDKRHLFRMGKENEVYCSGTTRIILEWHGWKICPLVCYDLRFPVWSRNLPTAPYDLLIYVANWPKARSFAWSTLLSARAIENQCYVAGVNRIGSDGHQIDHQGDSAILNFFGEEICNLVDRSEITVSAISYFELQEFRIQFPVLSDADSFKIETA